MSEAERYRKALENIRLRCFDDSEWARYIDLVLVGKRQTLDHIKAGPRLDALEASVSEHGERSDPPQSSRSEAPGEAKAEPSPAREWLVIGQHMPEGYWIVDGPPIGPEKFRVRMVEAPEAREGEE